MTNIQTVSRKNELPLKGENTSLFLQVIISIAVFIFAITLSGVLSIDSMISNWNKSILGSLTVQIIPINNANKEKARLSDSEVILNYLRNMGGSLPLGNLSTPEEIYKKLHISKSAFKRAVGHLYKLKLITIEDYLITLNE
jgi:cell division protein FtsX